MIAPKETFEIFRKDRCGRGGGTFIITRKSKFYSSKSVPLPSKFNHLDVVCVDLLFSLHRGVRIICFYLPPSVVQLNDTLTCNAMLSTFNYLSDTFLPICIVGDLNLPNMNWSASLSPS